MPGDGATHPNRECKQVCTSGTSRHVTALAHASSTVLKQQMTLFALFYVHWLGHLHIRKVAVLIDKDRH